MSITRQQCRAARVGLSLKRAELAAMAGIGERTLVDFERGARQPHKNNIAAIKSALEEAGCEFGPRGWVRLPLPD